jgi:ribosome-binding protein aMBF1 (putative translation factor)
MPKKSEFNESEEDPNMQQWSPIVIKKEQILTKEKKEITIDQFIHKLIESREQLKLSQIQLNVKCKFPYKYTIRDIESKRTYPTALEIRTISLLLNI